MSETGFPPSGKLDRFGEVELKSQSKSPVSQAVASSGTTAWHPYRSRIRINATSAVPRTSWLRPSSINREHTLTPPGSIRGRLSPFLRRRLHHPVPGVISGLFWFGDPQLLIFFVWTFVGCQLYHEHRMTSALRPSYRHCLSILGVSIARGHGLSAFAALPATIVKSIPVFIGTGSTPIFVGVVDGSA